MTIKSSVVLSRPPQNDPVPRSILDPDSGSSRAVLWRPGFEPIFGNFHKPGKMFSNTPIPVTIWLFNLNPSSRNKKNKEVLMIDLEGSETRSSKRKNFLNSETINMISAKIICYIIPKL